MLFYYITDRHAFPGTEAEKRVRLLAKIAEAARSGVDFIQLREKDLTPHELERLAREAVQVVRDHTPLESSGAAHLPAVGRCGPAHILINSRTDIALAVGADGVHLTSTDVSPSDVRIILGKASTDPSPLTSDPFLIGVSCHTVDEVRRAASQGADFAVFAPVFEKSVASLNEEQEGALHPSQKVRGWEERNIVSQRSREEGLTVLKRAVGQSVYWEGHDFSRAANSYRISAPSGAEVSPSGPTQPVEPVMPILALGGITIENARDCITAGAAGIAAIRLFQENNIAEVVGRLRSS